MTALSKLALLHFLTIGPIAAICDSKEIWIPHQESSFDAFVREMRERGHSVDLEDHPYFGDSAVFSAPIHSDLPDWSRFFTQMDELEARLIIARSSFEKKHPSSGHLVFHDIRLIVAEAEDMDTDLVSPFLWRALTGLSIVHHHHHMRQKILQTFLRVSPEGELVALSSIGEQVGMLTMTSFDWNSRSEWLGVLDDLASLREDISRWRILLRSFQTKSRKLRHISPPIHASGSEWQEFSAIHRWMNDYKIWSEVEGDQGIQLFLPLRRDARYVGAHLQRLNVLLKSLEKNITQGARLLEKCKKINRRKFFNRMRRKLLSWLEDTAV